MTGTPDAKTCASIGRQECQAQYGQSHSKSAPVWRPSRVLELTISSARGFSRRNLDHVTHDHLPLCFIILFMEAKIESRALNCSSVLMKIYFCPGMGVLSGANPSFGTSIRSEFCFVRFCHAICPCRDRSQLTKSLAALGCGLAVTSHV